MAHQYGAKVLFLRRTFPQLEGKPIPRSKELIPRSLAKYRETRREWDFFMSGGSIKFGYLDKKGDEENYQGSEFCVICFDELTHFSYDQYSYLLSRNRTTNPRIKRPKVLCGSNPGSRGHAWVRSRWITGHKPEEIWEAERTTEMVAANLPARRRVFIPAQLTDNEVLMKADPGYMARLMELPENQKRMLLYGDWDYFDGMAFSDFKPDKHVIKPFQIPDTWRRFRAIDYGRSAPYCALWFAIDQDGDVFVYRELYEAGVNASDQADRIVKASMMVTDDGDAPEKFEYTMLDTACWIKNQHGESIAETYANHGLHAWQADKNRLQGKARIHEWLKLDENGNARLHIFDTCTNLIYALSNLPSDPDNIEDVDTDSDFDHSYDALRYGLMSRPRPTKRQEPEKTVIQQHKEKVIKRRNQSMRRFA